MKKTLLIAAMALIMLGGQSLFAEVIDLRTASCAGGSFSFAGCTFGEATAVTGGTYRAYWTPAQPTGTGYIDPFLQIQAGGNTPVERGYNTDIPPGGPANFDTQNTAHTHSIKLGDVPKVTIDGVTYREFFLDINQVSRPCPDSGDTNCSYLSLDQVQIFMGAKAPLNVTLAQTAGCSGPCGGGNDQPDVLNSFAGATEVFKMSIQGGNNAPTVTDFIYLDYDLNHGSGSGDMLLEVRDSAFAGYSNNDFVTLFSSFGSPNGPFAANDGFEEWAFRAVTPTTTPEPASLTLLGTGLLGIEMAKRRARKK